MVAGDPVLQAVLASIGHDLSKATLEPIHGGKSGGRVFRLRRHDQTTMILKIMEPDQAPAHLRQDYPQIGETEWRFYTELGPQLAIPLPELYAAGQVADTCSYLLMEDLCHHHRIPSEDHHWTDDEMRSILATYALFHGRSMRYLTSHPTPIWLHGDDRERFSPSQFLSCLKRLYDHPQTQVMVASMVRSPGLEPFLARVNTGLRAVSTSLLYNDFYPSNVALPLDGGLAKLFDWQLVGVGPLHLDMVNIGLLGRRTGFDLVDRTDLLGFYLDQLSEQTGKHSERDVFMTQYFLAALLAWGVFAPRMVDTLYRTTSQGKTCSPWLVKTLADFVTEWQDAVKHLI